MILTLARGHYCPKEHQQHLELAAFHPKIAVAYTQIVTIATDEHHTLQEFRASVGAQWTFLSDPGRTIQRDLDIQEYTDPDHDPMIPHTLVLKPGLVVHSIYNGYWFWGRPSVDDLWRDLRAATSEIRPDWDLATPGLRERVGRGRLVAVPRLGQGRARAGSRRRATRGTPRPGMIAHAALTSPMWLNAWGKLPSSSPLVGSTSSASRPTSLTNAAARSNDGARPVAWPAMARAWASQKVQSRKVPSSPSRPSRAR